MTEEQVNELIHRLCSEQYRDIIRDFRDSSYVEVADKYEADLADVLRTEGVLNEHNIGFDSDLGSRESSMRRRALLNLFDSYDNSQAELAEEIEALTEQPLDSFRMTPEQIGLFKDIEAGKELSDYEVHKSDETVKKYLEQLQQYNLIETSSEIRSYDEKLGELNILYNANAFPLLKLFNDVENLLTSREDIEYTESVLGSYQMAHD